MWKHNPKIRINELRKIAQRLSACYKVNEYKNRAPVRYKSNAMKLTYIDRSHNQFLLCYFPPISILTFEKLLNQKGILLVPLSMLHIQSILTSCKNLANGVQVYYDINHFVEIAIIWHKDNNIQLMSQ